MENVIKGSIVTNVITGMVGVVRAIWTNEVTGQEVYNVRIGTAWVSWNAAVTVVSNV